MLLPSASSIKKLSLPIELFLLRPWLIAEVDVRDFTLGRSNGLWFIAGLEYFPLTSA
jgi:hypothetical protein